MQGKVIQAVIDPLEFFKEGKKCSVDGEKEGC